MITKRTVLKPLAYTFSVFQTGEEVLLLRIYFVIHPKKSVTLK